MSAWFIINSDRKEEGHPQVLIEVAPIL